MASRRKSYRKKAYSGGQGADPSAAPAPAPATLIDDPVKCITALAKHKNDMINTIQSALQSTDPTILSQMSVMQGSDAAISTGAALAAHINDPANQDETIQQLYSYMQSLFATVNVNFPNLNFNADGTLNLVVVSSPIGDAMGVAPAPAPIPANPAFLAVPPTPVRQMTPAAQGATYEAMIAAGWTDRRFRVGQRNVRRSRCIRAAPCARSRFPRCGSSPRRRSKQGRPNARFRRPADAGSGHASGFPSPRRRWRGRSV